MKVRNAEFYGPLRTDGVVIELTPEEANTVVLGLDAGKLQHEMYKEIWKLLHAE